MRRLRLEVLRFLEARDLLLGVGLVDSHWHESSGAEEVWRALLAADFDEVPEVANSCKYQQVWRSRSFAIQMNRPWLSVYRLPSMRILCSILMEHMSDEGSGSMSSICYLRSGALFISGGRDAHRSFKQTFQLMPQESDLLPLPDMHMARYAHGTIQVEKDVYCFGGSSEPLVGHAIRDAEKYSLETGTWTCLPTMHSNRMLFCPAQLHNKIYIIGGCWTHNSEIFDVQSSSFESLQLSSPFGTYPCCTVAIGSTFYFFGGGVAEQWTPTSTSRPTTIATSDEEESLPFGYLAAVRVGKAVFLYGDDQSIYRFSLEDRSFTLALEFTSTAVDFEEDMDDSPREAPLSP